MNQPQQQQQAKSKHRRSLDERVSDALAGAYEVDVDTDAVFALIEGALRKNLGLTYAQCDAVLADVRAEIEQLIDEAVGSAVDFNSAVDAVLEEFTP